MSKLVVSTGLFAIMPIFQVIRKCPRECVFIIVDIKNYNKFN